MKQVMLKALKALLFSILVLIIIQLVNSSLDIYNNFAFDKAVMRTSPYGYIPLLNNPNNYSESNAEIKGGDFVYVENWESADNGSVVFAKVRSKFSSGYVNNRLLVETNINVMPVFSVIMLLLITAAAARKVYLLIHKDHKIVFSKN